MARVMTNFSKGNDQRRIERMMEMFMAIGKMELETPEGKEFHESIKESLNEIIKPAARECWKKLK